MPSARRVLPMLVVLVLLSCGGPAPPPSSAVKDPRCAGFELDVERVWNVEAKAEIKSRFIATGVVYAERMYESVVTQMDDATRDWVMLRESLCTDCLVRGLVPREVYAPVSLCYDTALIRQRTAITLFRSADAVTVEKAFEVFLDISDRLESCQRDAARALYQRDAANPDQEAVRDAEAKAAEAELALELGRKEGAARAAEESAKAAEKVQSGRIRAGVLFVEGRSARDDARYDEATAKIEQAVALSRESGDKVTEGNCLVQLGWTKSDQGEYREALDDFDQAEALYVTVLDRGSTELGALQVNRGNTYNLLAEFNMALECFEQALDIFTKAYGDDSPYVANIFNHIGLAWDGLGQYEKALGHYGQSLEIYRKVFGDGHPRMAVVLNNIGLAWRHLGKFEKAIEYYEQALRLDRAARGDAHPAVARDLNNIGVSWRHLGEYEKALGYYDQALAIYRKVYGEEHPLVATSLNNIGLAWKKLGQYEKALGYYEQSLEISKKVYGGEHPLVAAALTNIGAVWDSADKCDKALEYFEDALRIRQKMLPADHPDLKTVSDWVDVCKEKLGR